MVTGRKHLSHFWVWLSHRNFIRFLQSGFNEQNNQRDTRQTVTKRRQCLSDGPNVTDLRAAACEGQAWHAAEQRGPRADPQSRLGNWLDAPDTSPLCSDASLYMKRSPASSVSAAAAAAAAAGLLSPLSSCLSPSKRMNLFISLHICVCVRATIVCLPFLNGVCPLSRSFISLPLCLVTFRLFSPVPALHLLTLGISFTHCSSVTVLVKHHTTHYKTVCFYIWASDSSNVFLIYYTSHITKVARRLTFTSEWSESEWWYNKSEEKKW